MDVEKDPFAKLLSTPRKVNNMSSWNTEIGQYKTETRPHITTDCNGGT